MSDIRITSWSELHERLFEGSWQPDLGRFRSTFAFRGIADAGDDLTTALLRGRYVDQEQHLLRNFRKYAQRDALPGDSIWNWLALAQHHGLPTRLLDWTYSPFVALHFATASFRKQERDAAIWCVDYLETAELLPDELRTILKNEGSAVFTAEMIDCVATTLAHFDRLSDKPFVVFLEPPSLDERIVNQFALFSLISDPRTSLDSWLERHPHLFRRIIIPASLKWEVRDKLDQANVTERVLFPGLDGLTSWLKRYYASAATPPDVSDDSETDPDAPREQTELR